MYQGPKWVQCEKKSKIRCSLQYCNVNHSTNFFIRIFVLAFVTLCRLRIVMSTYSIYYIYQDTYFISRYTCTVIMQQLSRILQLCKSFYCTPNSSRGLEYSLVYRTMYVEHVLVGRAGHATMGPCYQATKLFVIAILLYLLWLYPSRQ